MKEIIITLTPSGEMKVEAEGYTGSSCQNATKFLKVLGVAQSEALKPEYYAPGSIMEELTHD